MINYLSVIIDRDADAELVEAVRREISGNVSGDVFTSLEAASFTGMMLADEEILIQHLPFFQQRFGYIALIQVVGAISGSLLQGMIIVSAASATLIAVVAGIYTMRFGALAVFGMMLLMPYLSVINAGRSLSPDAPAALFFLLFASAIGRRPVVACLLGGIMVSIRPDYIVFATMLVAMAFFFKRIQLKNAVLSILLAVLALAYSKLGFEGYSHLKLFHYTLISLDMFPATMTVSTDIGDYVRAYIGGVYGIVFGEYMLLYVLIVTVIFCCRGALKDNEELLLGLAAVAMIAVHFLLLPAGFDRFYVAPHVLIALALLARATGSSTFSSDLQKSHQSTSFADKKRS